MTVKIISSVSEDIIISIADHVVGMNGDTLKGWKSSLMLLWINKSWREALIPVIYSRLYSVYRESNVQKNKEDSTHEGTFVNHLLKTNLDLVAISGYINLSKIFSIEVEDPEGPINGLKSIMANMNRYGCSWTHIKYMRTWMRSSFKHETEDFRIIQTQDTEVDNIVDKIFKLMPRIVKLNLGQAVENRVTKTLIEKLAKTYSGQATSLICNRALNISRSCYFPRLTCLKIKLISGQSRQIPIVCAETLQHLSIDNLPINSMWPALDEDDKIQRVEFSNLRFLTISFNGYAPSALKNKDTQPSSGSMIFPKLNCLTVHNIDGFCALVNRAVFPKRLGKLDLTGEMENFNLLNKKIMPRVARLSLNMLNVDRGGSGGMFTVASRLSWKGQEHTSVSILATGGVEFDLSKEPSCTCITKLVFSRPTSANTLLAIIKEMPQIVDLRLYRLVTKDLPSTITIQSYAEHKKKRLQPFDTHIKTMELSYRPRESPLAKSVALIIHIIVRIPSLERFSDIKTPPEMIAELTTEIEPLYPHLPYVKYSST